MRLAETDTAVQEDRVEGLARSLAYTARGAERHFVARPHHERVEGIMWDELADSRRARAAHLGGLGESLGVFGTDRGAVLRDDEPYRARTTEFALSRPTHRLEKISFDPRLEEHARYLQYQLLLRRNQLDRFDPGEVVALPQDIAKLRQDRRPQVQHTYPPLLRNAGERTCRASAPIVHSWGQHDNSPPPRPFHHHSTPHPQAPRLPRLSTP